MSLYIGKKKVALSKEDIIDLIYPVSSIYISIGETNPETIFGGTWEQLPNDTYLVSGAYTGETIGANEKTITTDNLPSHTHSFSATTSEDGIHFHKLWSTGDGVSGDSFGFDNSGYAKGVAATSNGTQGWSAYLKASGHDAMSNDGSHTHTVGGNTGSVGSGTAFNVQPKSLQVYMWKRTA